MGTASCRTQVDTNYARTSTLEVHSLADNHLNKDMNNPVQRCASFAELFSHVHVNTLPL